MTAEGTVPTVGTRAYIDTELSFEKDPAELGGPGSVDVDTHQTLTAREKAVFSSKRLKHLIICTVGERYSEGFYFDSFKVLVNAYHRWRIS